MGILKIFTIMIWSKMKPLPMLITTTIVEERAFVATARIKLPTSNFMFLQTPK